MKHNKNKFQKLLLTASIASILGAISQSTLAQVVTVDVADTEADAVEIVITGTSIRGIAPVGSAPITYGRADIEADSPVDIRDALSNVPQISNFGTDADVSTSNRFRTAGYQPIIHNLGIYSTLTLFNGHRMADVGGEAVFPDPAILPTIAVQQVEVIADGASAIYGSDAVAGVVNFIYRRNFEGFEMSTTRGEDPDTSWQNTNLSGIWGKQFNRGGVMLAYEYSDFTRPSLDEFKLSADADHRPYGYDDERTQNCPDPRVNFNGQNYAGPGLTPGSYRCNPNGPVSIASNGERHAFLGTAQFELNDTVELWTELNYSNYDSTRFAGWGNGGRFQFDIASTNPFFTVPDGADPTGVTSENIRGDAVGYFGHRARNASSKVMGFTGGADVDLGSDWQATVMVHKSKTEDWNYDPGLDLQNLTRLTEEGKFNPFDVTGNDQAVLDQINNGFVQLNDTSQSLTELSVKADGPAFEISGGDVMAAIGVSYRGQRARQIQSAGCQTCSFYQVVRDDNITRGVSAVFGELVVPVISGANSFPGVEEFTIALAGRYDKYDGLGGQFNPKVGFTWVPISDLSLNGSWGTSFVAPNMGLITSIFGVPQPNTNDRDPEGRQQQYDIYNLGGGNPDLGPEEAESFSYGFQYTPEFVDGLSIGVTYYEVEYSDNIYKPTRSDVLTNPAFADSVRLGEIDPVTGAIAPFDTAFVDSLIAAAPPQTPILDGQTFNMMFNSFAINLGTRIHAGYDFNVNYNFDSSVGLWDVGVIANQQTKFEEEVVPGTGSFSRIGTRQAPGWQTRYQIQWEANSIPLRASLVSNYKSGYEDGTQTLDSHLLHNFTISYEFPDVLEGVTLQGRVRNLLDDEPPYYANSEGYDEDNHTPYGRQFELTLRAKF